jgi:hypothetical protein
MKLIFHILFLLAVTALPNQVGHAQHSQILFDTYRIAIIGNLEFSDKILFLRESKATVSELDEFYEFQLDPSGRSFIQRSSIQFSKDPADYMSKRQYSHIHDSIHKIIKLPPFPEPGDMVIIEEYDEGVNRLLTESDWNRPELISFTFCADDSSLTMVPSGPLFLPNDVRLGYIYNNDYNLNHHVDCQWFDLTSGIILGHSESIGQEMQNQLLSHNTDHRFDSFKRIYKEHFFNEFPYYLGLSSSTTGYYNAHPNKYINANKELYNSISHLKDYINLQTESDEVQLNRRELPIPGLQRSFLILVGDNSIVEYKDEDIFSECPFRLLYITIDEHDSLNLVQNYCLPTQLVLRSKNGEEFRALSSQFVQYNKCFSLVVLLNHYWEALRAVCLDKNGTMNFFAHKGKTTRVESFLSKNSDWFAKQKSAKFGLFQIKPNGRQTFIPIKKLLDNSVELKTAIPMIQTDNNSHCVIAKLVAQTETSSEYLYVQKNGAKTFSRIESLPEGFRCTSMYEVGPNKLAIVGELSSNSTNADFFVDSLSFKTSILIVDLNVHAFKNSIKPFVVKQIDLKSGHVYCQNSSSNSTIIIPLKIEENLAAEIYYLKGSLLIGGQSIHFEQTNNILNFEGKSITTVFMDQKETLETIINFYFGQK